MPGAKRRPSVPFVLPGWVIGRWTVRAFNEAYYRKHLARVSTRIAHPESFFYPLDKIRNWNRLYGPRGFTQYQCVLPDAAGHGAARRFLELLTRRGGASMLCVIKDCGPEGIGLLSFPKPGISIALDIPVRDETQSLVDALNELVIARGRAGLPGQGPVHARGAFSRHGAAVPRVAAHPAAVGPRGAHQERPVGAHLRETGRECRHPRGDQGHGPRRRATHGRARGQPGSPWARPNRSRTSARDLEVRGGAATGSIKTALCDLEDPRPSPRRSKRPVAPWAASTP